MLRSGTQREERPRKKPRCGLPPEKLRGWLAWTSMGFPRAKANRSTCIMI